MVTKPETGPMERRGEAFGDMDTFFASRSEPALGMRRPTNNVALSCDPSGTSRNFRLMDEVISHEHSKFHPNEAIWRESWA
jgi:hypothetical protein